MSERTTAQIEVLDRLTAGSLAVVTARAGVGKTAYLIQHALDALLDGQDVLHLALGQSLEHVQARYDVLLADRIEPLDLPAREAARETLVRHRAIHASAEVSLPPAKLREVLAKFQTHLALKPALILVTGYVPTMPLSEVAAHLDEYRAIAREAAAIFWLTVRAADGESAQAARTEAFRQVSDVLLTLEPAAERVGVRVAWAFGQAGPAAPVRWLDPVALRPPTPAAPAAVHLAAGHCALLSGGAEGSEAEFGACAEAFGVAERTFSFPGRAVSRTRGLVLLSEEELRQGDVSWTYLKNRMKRSYRETDDFRKVLQTLWHQVRSAGEVFAIGTIQPDTTVKGGTGWAVELAKHQKKPLYVFDQGRGGWFEWKPEAQGASPKGAWVAIPPPAIQHAAFAGTGTRSLTDTGRRAIRELFDRSFRSDPSAQ